MKLVAVDSLAVRKIGMTLVLGVAALLAGARGVETSLEGTSGSREVSSVRFPRYQLTEDVDDILKEYPEYLRFVLTIGKQVNPAAAARLEKSYVALRRRDSVASARFLRGLRFEMVQKLEFIGASPAQISSETPAIRRWVAKFLPQWAREADEYNFRAFTAQIARRE